MKLDKILRDVEQTIKTNDYILGDIVLSG